VNPGPPTSIFDRPVRRTGLLAVVGLHVLLYAASWLLPSVGPWPVDPVDPIGEVVGLAVTVLWLVVCLLALSSARTVRLGWLIVVSSLADAIWLLGFIQIHALYFVSDTFAGLATAVMAHILIAYPSGRLADPFDRVVVRATYAYVVIGGAFRLLIHEPGFTCDPYCPRNPFAVLANEPLRRVYDDVTAWLVPVIGVVVAIAVVRHWRATGPVGRRVLLPVLIALPFVYLVNSAGYLARNFEIDPILDVVSSPIVQLTSIAMPLAMLIGILRTRLARGRLAELAVELGRGVPLGGLRDALARTLRDPTLELAFAAPGGGGLVDPEGRPFAAPEAGARRRTVARLERDDGELLGVLVHDPAVDDEDPGLVPAVASVARLALENERLAAQVRAQLDEVRSSRLRIVEAGDAERRRVERDLHDGAQQRLVALAMRLEAARTTVDGASDLIDRMTAELRAAIGEVRDLARGLHPPILTEAGLRAAIESLAERTPIPVEIEATDRRYPAEIETAAYFVAAEALTNVARYADAGVARVALREANDRLVLEVADDGRGGADPGAGSGLRGLEDRLAALGGTLTVASVPGSGTTVRAELPLP
jgi:signal transduction histidine kinase